MFCKKERRSNRLLRQFALFVLHGKMRIKQNEEMVQKLYNPK